MAKKSEDANEAEGTELMTVSEQEMAAFASNESAVERPSVGSISFRSGILTWEGNEVPDNNMDCIIVASAYENRWYKGAWNPDAIESPDCFALGMAEGVELPVMAPHENVVEPVHPTCKGCKLNEWNSDPRPNSRAKACKEIRRLAIIPFKEGMTAEEITGAEIAIAKIPVTSVKNWSNYVNMVGAKASKPTWAVVTNLSVKPHSTYQLQVNFGLTGVMESALWGALNQKRQAVVPALMVPYDGKGEQEEAPADSDKY